VCGTASPAVISAWVLGVIRAFMTVAMHGFNFMLLCYNTTDTSQNRHISKLHNPMLVPKWQDQQRHRHRTISPVVGSFVTAAVKPTPDEPLPVVYTARGEMLHTYRSS